MRDHHWGAPDRREGGALELQVRKNPPPRRPNEQGTTKMDQITEPEVQGLLDRDRIMALMNRYFATIDDASSLDAEWARSIFSDDVRVEHRGFTLKGIEDLAQLLAIHVHPESTPPGPYVIANVFEADALRTIDG